MGVELALALETRFGTQTALSNSVGEFNVWTWPDTCCR